MKHNQRLAGAVLALTPCLILLGCCSVDGAQPTQRASDPGAAAATCLPAAEADAGAACPVLPTLASKRVRQPPLVDGQIDDIWSDAVPLSVPLSWGRHGDVQAMEVTLRSLHSDEAIYFLVEWPSPHPAAERLAAGEAAERLAAGEAAEPAAVRNRLTLHFDLPAPTVDAAERMCLVTCHTAFADEGGRLAYVSAETIPPGRTAPLPAAGGWEAGTWRLEWSRPLRIDNLFDLQFEDLEQSYPFFVKVFVWQEGQADPVSPDCLLVFQP